MYGIGPWAVQVYPTCGISFVLPVGDFSDPTLHFG